MVSLKDLIKKMSESLEAQKRDINQLYLVTQHAITDIYRANSYEAQLQGILVKISGLLDIQERLKHNVQDMTDREKKQYAQLLNNIATELQFLKATSEAMDETLKKLKQSGDIEHAISGNVLGLKRKMDKIIRKTEKLLSDY